MHQLGAARGLALLAAVALGPAEALRSKDARGSVGREESGSALLEASSSAGQSSQWVGWNAAASAYAALRQGPQLTPLVPLPRDGHLGRAAGQSALTPVPRGLAAHQSPGFLGQFDDEDDEEDHDDDHHRHGDLAVSGEPKPNDSLRRLFLMDKDVGPLHVLIPPNWMDRIMPQTVRRISSSKDGEVFRAQSKQDQRLWVVMKTLPTDSVEARRELAIRKRMQAFVDSGAGFPANVINMLAHEVYETNTYMLMPSAEANLKTLLDVKRQFVPKRAGLPIFPYDAAVVVTIDILVGLMSLEGAGILHNDLCEGNVLLSSGRAFISDLSSACLVYEDRDGSVCEEVLPSDPTALRLSAVRVAPEMLGGLPTGHSNSIWSAGLILARMVLGYVPTMPKGQRYEDDEDLYRMRDQVGERAAQRERIEKIRGRIATTFDISKRPGFDRLPGKVQTLLKRMLSTDPKTRATAEEALKLAVEAARDLGVMLEPPAALPFTLPKGWSEPAPTK